MFLLTNSAVDPVLPANLEPIIPKTSVEPPNTPKHAEKTMTYLKNC